MAQCNPFFEKARMQRVAESKLNPHVTKALKQLETLGIDTALLAGTQYTEHAITKIGPQNILKILEELSKHNGAVRRRLAGIHNVYPKH